MCLQRDSEMIDSTFLGYGTVLYPGCSSGYTKLHIKKKKPHNCMHFVIKISVFLYINLKQHMNKCLGWKTN